MKSAIVMLTVWLVVSCEDLNTKQNDLSAEDNNVTAVDDDDEDLDEGSGDDAGQIDVDEDVLTSNEGAQLNEGAVLNMEVLPSTGSLAIDSLALLNGGPDSPPYFGQNTVAQLESLKYYILSIRICESIDISGTAYSNPQNCISVYENERNAAVAYGDYKYQHAKASDEGYIDFMNKDSLAKLSTETELNESSVGTYNYGLVNWMQPIKFKGSVTLNNGTTVYTKDHEPTYKSDGNGWSWWDNNPTTLTGPAQEAIVIHNNGGAWFKFAKPLVVTEEDIENEEAFQLDLTFNPEAILSAEYHTPVDPEEGDPNPGYKLSIPLLQITPIAHKVDNPVMVETYRFTFEGINPIEQAQELAQTKVQIRVELFYLKDDEEKSIYGVNSHLLYTAQTRSHDGFNVHQTFSVTEGADGEISLNNWQDQSMFEGFVRLDTVGAQGDAQFYLGHETLSLIDMTYTLSSDRELRSSEE